MKSVVFAVLAAVLIGGGWYFSKMRNGPQQSPDSSQQTAAAPKESQEAAPATPAPLAIQGEWGGAQAAGAPVTAPGGTAGGGSAAVATTGGAKRLAPAGTYYTLQPISVTTDDGITGVQPGTLVTLVQDNGATKVVTTDGKMKFDVAAGQITNDLDVVDQMNQAQSQAALAQAAAQQQAAAAPRPQPAVAARPGMNSQELSEQRMALQQGIDTLTQQKTQVEAQMTALQAQISRQEDLNTRHSPYLIGAFNLPKGYADMEALKKQDKELGTQLDSLQSQLNALPQ